MTELVKRWSPSEIIESIVNQNVALLPPYFSKKYEPGARTWLLKLLLTVPLVNRIVPSIDEKQELIQRLTFEQQHATTYKEWYAASTQLDELTGSNAWKLNPELCEYDYKIVSQQLNEMRRARLAKDHNLLLYLVRTKWSRNVGNMGDLNLYRHSHVGTKRLIEEYNEECHQALRYLVHDPEVDFEDKYLLGMLIQTRKNIGRTALVLSGGSTFGVSHIGVLIALLENNLLPRVISGSSAGSIIASILCTHTNEETFDLLKSILNREFNFFGSHSAPNAEGRVKALLQRLSHFLKYGTVFGISGIRDTVYGFVGDLTFREAYNRTGKILNITVSPASTHEQTRLLNYLTGPHCIIWSAVCASCSVPGIFSSNSIYEKDPRTNRIREWNNDQSSKFVDGSVDGDLPITRLSEMFNVDHIIAVQVNPHVLPILKVSVGNVGGKMDLDFSHTLRNTMNNCYDFISSEIIHYLQVCHELNVQKNFTLKVILILTQQYSGDITILPDLSITDFLSLFSNPTPEFLMDFILKGVRAAWPKITIINNHCGVEFALDKEISVLRGRIISNSAKRITHQPSAAIFNMATSDSNCLMINSPMLDSGDYFS
ncbi:patatin-domain-containing protein, partial [Metschnikowia bicuspidata]